MILTIVLTNWQTMRGWLYGLLGVCSAWNSCQAQEQFLGKTLKEVQTQLSKDRIRYEEQSSPMGDATTLSYSPSESNRKRVDLYIAHFLRFRQDNKNACDLIMSYPMMQQNWVADTLKNRLIQAGFKAMDHSRFWNETRHCSAQLEYVNDLNPYTQQPTKVRMLRVSYTSNPKQPE
ncbi:hypothetical protein [Larkinella rosea]|uniref:Uncharacterized protein n=1 Tax=Larkinella rosea TaxID=2025312 RepID=A0A3P1BAL0_9BACT|nr:hypothetical protein [Larkinella rosea]RRA98075.1 hypothetical protein EHT25_30875 [Larkinella rosea]